MPEPGWVLQNVEFEAQLEGGEFDAGTACVRGYREGKQYRVSASIYRAGGKYYDLSPNVPDAGINRMFSTLRDALNKGFLSILFQLNNGTGRTRIKSVEQKYIHWTLLDKDGKTDWAAMDKLSQSERAEKTNQKFDYTPPTSEGMEDRSRPRQVGRAYDYEVGESEGTAEGNTANKNGGKSTVDARMAADKGLEKFMRTQGMAAMPMDGEEGDGPSEVSSEEPEIQKNEMATPSVSGE